VPGDLAEHVPRDTSVGHPRQAGVAEPVAAQVLEPERRDNLVPVGGVPEHRGGDPATAGPGEQPGVGPAPDDVDPVLDQTTHLGDQRDEPRPLASGALVDEAAGEGVVLCRVRSRSIDRNAPVVRFGRLATVEAWLPTWSGPSSRRRRRKPGEQRSRP
jgi:hypothetical protein